MKVNDVIKEADPKKEFISIEKGEVSLVMVFDHEALVKKNEKKIVRLYKLMADGESVEPIDTKKVISRLVNAVKGDVKVDELLSEVFSNTPPELLLKLDDKLRKAKEQSVKDSNPHKIRVGSSPTYHCCYSLVVEDKDGKIEIPISGGRYDRGG
jgi:hypothetical protein